MQSILEKCWSNPVRFALGISLAFGAWVLSLTVLPLAMPSGEFRNVVPILIFGSLSLYLAIFIAISVRDDNLGEHICSLVATVVMAFFVGSVIGASASGTDLYGIFLGVVCGGLALIGVAVSFILPDTDDMQYLLDTWNVTSRY